MKLTECMHGSLDVSRDLVASSKIVAWSIGPGGTEMRTCKTSERGTLEYRVRRSGSLRVFGNCVCMYSVQIHGMIILVIALVILMVSYLGFTWFNL